MRKDIFNFLNSLNFEIHASEQDVLSNILENLSLHISGLKIYPDPYDSNTMINFEKSLMVKSGNLLRNDSAVESIWLSTESYERPYGYQDPIISEIHISNINKSLKILVQLEKPEFFNKLINAFPKEIEIDEEMMRYTFIRQLNNLDKNEVMQFIQYLDSEIDPIGKDVMDSMFEGMLLRYTELQPDLAFNRGLQFSNDAISSSITSDFSNENKENDFDSIEEKKKKLGNKPNSPG